MVRKTPVREIRIKVVSENKGDLKQIARDLGVLNKSAKSSAKSLKGFSNAFKFSVAGFGVRQIIKMADSFQLLRDRIKVFTGDGVEAQRIFDKLIIGARETRTSVKSLGESFNRMALATQELGLSTDEILVNTKLLQQTFRLSGSTIAESTAAVIQLSQGLSSGAVRGQELRSVLESNAVFVSLLAKELNVTRGNLIKFGETGKITSEVVLKTLSKAANKLNADAKELGTTFEQSLTIAMDAFGQKISELNDEFGLNSKFEKGILFAIEHLDILSTTVGILAGAQGISLLVSLFKNLNGALALGKLTSFISALNPLTLILAGIAAAGVGVVAVLTKIAAKSTTRDGLTERFDKQLIVVNRLQKRLDIYNNTVLSAFAKGNEEGVRTQKFLNSEITKYSQRLEGAKDELVSIQKQITIIDKKEFAKKLNGGIKTASSVMKLLNAEFESGKININQYREAISIINMDKLKEDFRSGKITVDAYNKAIQETPEHLTQAQFAFAAFSNSADSFNSTLSLLESTFTKTFSGMEDAMVELFTNGSFDFRQFANSIIKDMVRIGIRTAITIPLLQAFKALIGGGAGVSTVVASPSTLVSSFKSNVSAGSSFLAKGGAFAGGPGQMAIFGEAGPEAVLPLTRGSGGELGVKAVGGGGGGSGTIVNIFNNTDSGVETKESTGPGGQRQIDIMIAGTVKGMFASGAMDRQMGQNYGLQRKGS